MKEKALYYSSSKDGLVMAMASCCYREVKPHIAYPGLQQVLMQKKHTHVLQKSFRSDTSPEYQTFLSLVSENKKRKGVFLAFTVHLHIPV